MQIAAVATARKLAVLCWHLIVKGEDYAFAQPSLVAHKRRKLQLRAGYASARGRKGTASGYSLKAVRTAERQLAAQAETAYRTMVAAWQPSKPTKARRAHTARSAVSVAATNGARQFNPSPGNAAR
jgi:transposase